MKAYTDLEQSKKLAEILPLESADMYWLNRHIDLTETKYEVFVIDKSNKYVDFFKSYAVAIDNNEIIPCWSLAALLDVLPDSIYDNTYEFSQLEFTKKSVAYIHGTTDGIKIGALKDNLVDACVEMITKLHELKIL